MIIEMRSYTLKPGSVPAAEENFGAALPNRTKLSKLAAFWHTEIGPLNQIIHVWPYESSAERDRIRAEATKLEGWPPKIQEFIVNMETKILIPAPFSPSLEPRRVGNVFEIRTYTYGPGSIPKVIGAWSQAIEARTKLSPLVGAWYTEVGPLNQWVHIWAYDDAAHRQRVRAEAQKTGVWPPKRAPEVVLLKQENALVVPASFSPIH